MKFFVRKVILWPKKSGEEKREVNFIPGAVNVITGVSQTGKSAIIPIIDYCLASNSCTIPVKVIRDATSWFGVLCDTYRGQLLLARREPGELKATNEMYYEEASEVEIPASAPESNTTTPFVRRLLDGYAGLSNLDLDFERTGSGFLGRPSFRDMTAFLFQPQNIIANSNVMFYGADSNDHMQKLRSVLPYFLGVISSQDLQNRHEAESLRRSLKRKQQEETSLREVSATWLAEAKSQVLRAKQLGLLTANSPSPESLPETLSLLSAASRTEEPILTRESVVAVSKELVSLQEQESVLSAELGRLKRRHMEMTSLRAAAENYAQAVPIITKRLSISSWLADQVKDKQTDCPLCGSRSEHAVTSLQQLVHALHQSEAESEAFTSNPAIFDREYLDVGESISEVTSELHGIRIRMQSIQRNEEPEVAEGFRQRDQWRLSGEISQSIKLYEQLGHDSELSGEIALLTARLNELRQVTNEQAYRAKLERILTLSGTKIQQLLSDLDVERPHDPVRLSIDDLTIKVIGQDREDFLWEIGSGANWVGYHVATVLGLHAFWLEKPEVPIPSFVVFDQPSQVYFPRKLPRGLAVAESDSTEEIEPDIDAVKKLYGLMSAFIASHQNDFQVIVIDHASEQIWGDFPNIHKAQEFTRQNRLIPESWIEATST